MKTISWKVRNYHSNSKLPSSTVLDPDLYIIFRNPVLKYMFCAGSEASAGREAVPVGLPAGGHPAGIRACQAESTAGAGGSRGTSAHHNTQGKVFNVHHYFYYRHLFIR